MTTSTPEAPVTETPAESDGGAGTVQAESEGSGFWNRRRLIWLLALLAAGLALVGAIFAWYLITHKPLTVIPGIPSPTTPHYSYSLYGVNQPIGVAVSSDGSRVYASESGGKMQVKILDREGKQIGLLPLPGKVNHIPLYMAINPTNQDVYLSDRATGMIYVYSAEGKYLQTFAPSGFSGSLLPLGLAFDKSGNLYVTQAVASTDQILVFDQTGALVRRITTPEKMSFPNGIAVNDAGDIVVTDSNNGRAFALHSDGKVFAQVTNGSAPGDLGMPRGAAFDSQGHLLIVDTTDHGVRVYKLASSGIDFLGTFGDLGVSDGMFQFPNGVAADSRAHVYVTDRVNNRVQVWSY